MVIAKKWENHSTICWRNDIPPWLNFVRGSSTCAISMDSGKPFRYLYTDTRLTGAAVSFSYKFCSCNISKHNVTTDLTKSKQQLQANSRDPETDPQVLRDRVG